LGFDWVKQVKKSRRKISPEGKIEDNQRRIKRNYNGKK
jgi:hypothetical protein